MLLILGVNCSIFDILLWHRSELDSGKYIVIHMNSDQNNRCNAESKYLIDRINHAYSASPSVIIIIS